jgi:hypothetical protein
MLTDGGVYDNTGFSSAALLDTERRNTEVKLSDLILVSDAGSPFQWQQFGEFTNPLALAFRASEVVMNRVAEETLRRIASDDRVGLVSIERIGEKDSLPPMIQRYISRIRTDLDRFSDAEVAALVKHGENKAANHLVQRFEVDPKAGAMNEFPISLPSSNETLAQALRTSWKVKWWNTFTNFSDFFPTFIIDVVGLAGLCAALLLIGAAYVHVVPLRSPIVESEKAIVQSVPVLKPELPPLQINPPVEANTAPPENHEARVNRCLDAIDMTLSVDQVRSLSRRCLQSK